MITPRLDDLPTSQRYRRAVLKFFISRDVSSEPWLEGKIRLVIASLTKKKPMEAVASDLQLKT